LLLGVLPLLATHQQRVAVLDGERRTRRKEAFGHELPIVTVDSDEGQEKLILFLGMA
jgi:hypothetical protein